MFETKLTRNISPHHTVYTIKLSRSMRQHTKTLEHCQEVKLACSAGIFCGARALNNPLFQFRTQSLQAFLSAVGRLERLRDNGISLNIF